MHVWMHSCGHVNDVIEEWIQCGVDVVNLQQPRNLGIEEIGPALPRAGSASPACATSKRTLPFGTDEEVRAEAACC